MLSIQDKPGGTLTKRGGLKVKEVSNMDKVVVVHDLDKAYGPVKVLDKVSMEVSKGEMFGLLGPNGAGKTTLIKILAGLIEPDGGGGRVLGFDLIREADEIRRRVILVRQESVSENYLTCKDLLEFYAKVYGMPRKERGRRVREVMEELGLEEHADKLLRECSGGVRRRAMLAKALLVKAPLVLLDEPTAGLDPRAKRSFWDKVRGMREEGSTIVLATHDMSEAEELCDRVLLIDKGKVVAVDTPLNLARVVGGNEVIEVVGRDLKDLMGEVEALKVKEVKLLSKEEVDVLRIYAEGATSLLPEVAYLAKRLKAVVTSINVRKPSLEDVFLFYVKGCS